MYRYGGCDRARTWRRLAATGRVWNRFEDRVETLDVEQLREFVDLSIVNELDIVEQAPVTARRYGDYFRTLFTSWKPLASPTITQDAEAVLGLSPDVTG